MLSQNPKPKVLSFSPYPKRSKSRISTSVSAPLANLEMKIFQNLKPISRFSLRVDSSGKPCTKHGFTLAKKGSLGTIWIATHLERKLRKNQVADADIGVSVGNSGFNYGQGRIFFPWVQGNPHLHILQGCKVKEHILAGDIFQIVLSQRFERRTFADPFEIYRALRVVNPSPYMSYMQARGCILVASSPEVLTCINKKKIVNRPLAGTIKRGKTTLEDEMLEMILLKDEKQCAEHIMLVDLGRNDVGKLRECHQGGVRLPTLQVQG